MGYELKDVQVYPADKGRPGFEVWEGGDKLFSIPDGSDAAVTAALAVYNTGFQDGHRTGRARLQYDLRHLLGAASEP